MSDNNNDIHYKIFKRVKSKAQSLEGGSSSLLKKYRSNQTRYANRPFQESSEDELISAIKKAQITYLGDFHTFDQNQRNLLRILKALIKNKNNIIVALEMVDYVFNDKINAYLNDHLTELEFLESINYHDSWRFPWNHYKLIFDMAKEHDFQIIGLNSRGNLKERDQFAASLLAQYLKTNTDYSLVVLFGEYHIAPNKIPKFTFDKAKQKELLQVIVHQNLDEVYFNQRSQNTDYPVIKYNDHEFCLMSSPPWVKYESQIYWFENLGNDPDFDLHEYLIEHGNKIFSDSAQDNFVDLVKEIVKTIGLKINDDIFDDFNLKDHTGLDYIEDFILREYSKKLQNFYQKLVIENQSFHLTGSNSFYCSNYSLNRLSYLAGNFIFYHFLNQKIFDERKTLEKGKNKDIFIYFVFKKMVSYYISKIINPHRKCDLYQDLVQSKYSCDQKSVLILDDLKHFDNYLKGLSIKSVFDIAESVGHFLGEYLFIKSVKENKTNNELIQQVLLHTDLSDSNFADFTLKLLSDTNYKSHKKRIF